jgi:hypothetical protein
MYSYTAYGLGIESNFHLPTLAQLSTGCDLRIRHEVVPLPSDLPVDTGWSGLQFSKVTPEEVLATVPRVAEIRVRRGREIQIRQYAGTDLQFLQLLVCGPVLAIVLYQLGAVVLHASAVEIDGAAVLFSGESGWGKSSLAAALHARGHRVITDDVTALFFQDGEYVVPGGPGQLKLGADVVETLGLREQSLPLIHPQSSKHALRPSTGSEWLAGTAAVPLRRLFFLDPESASGLIEPLAPQQALVELLRLSYGVHRLLPAAPPDRYFMRCSAIARGTGAARLSRRPTVDTLPALAETVEQELRLDLRSCVLNHPARTR